jgi:hypothetical protein
MKRPAILFALLIAFCTRAAAVVDYEKDIKPLLKERCVSCHGSVKQKGDLRLDAGALIDKSIHADLLERVTSHDEDERMPPEGARLTSSQVEALKHWFAAGAPFPSGEVIPKKPSEHWSFQPVKRPQMPESASKHPIDAFVFGEHESSPQASPQALLRRIHLDLIGLPPTPDEQTRFLSDLSDASDMPATTSSHKTAPGRGRGGRGRVCHRS